MILDGNRQPGIHDRRNHCALHLFPGAFHEFFHRISNLPDLVQWAGLFGIAAIIFSETGLLVGVFLPGDSLLVTAGLFAAK